MTELDTTIMTVYTRLQFRVRSLRLPLLPLRTVSYIRVTARLDAGFQKAVFNVLGIGIYAQTMDIARPC